MNNAIIHLSHGQQIVVPSFRFTNKIELVTPSGYALEHGDCPKEAEERATKFGHEFLACFKHPSIITADYNGKAERLEAERKEWEEAQRIKGPRADPGLHGRHIQGRLETSETPIWRSIDL